MTPEEFKKARQALGLTQFQLARLLNANPRTVSRWEEVGGGHPPNPIACRALEWMLDGYRPSDWPAKVPAK